MNTVVAVGFCSTLYALLSPVFFFFVCVQLTFFHRASLRPFPRSACLLPFPLLAFTLFLVGEEM